ncbi:MAG TPA: hypothetical protein PK379_00655 [Candidatus Hydrogenedentes bacterium]|nr:hypothetical protein [Candidatus Hydrogenedentota bacterium]HOK88513.1 hypothetical protein [Candidatus Hydrogenedentota bacterium]
MRRGGLVRRGDARRAGWVMRACVVFTLISGAALADANPIRALPRLVDSLDDMARDAVSGILGRRDNASVAQNADGLSSGPFTEKRESENLYPTGATPVVSISSVFTNLAVDVWDERLVRVRAEITTEAGDAAQAKQLADAVSISTQAAENLVEIRVTVPSVANIPRGAVGVVCQVTVPRQASVILENQFGDARVTDVQGMAGLDVSYGAVTLERIGGDVRARALGEVPFTGTDLARGGTFELKGARVDLRRISGTVKLSNFGGSVRIAEPGDALNADLTVDGGEVELVVDPASPGDIGISGVCSSLDSAIPLDRSEQGDRLVARRAQPDAARRWSVNASFSKIRITEAASREPRPEPLSSLSPPVTDTLSQSGVVPPMPVVMVELAPGDLMVEPAEEGQVSVTVTRSVRDVSAADAARILEDIRLEMTPLENGVRIRTTGPADVTSGASGMWRADVLLRIPRDATLDVNASEGNLAVTALEKSLRVRLGRGEARITRCAGPVELDTIAGDARVTECSGPVKITAERGNLRLERVSGTIAVNAGSGSVLVDAPRSATRVETESGEVRLISLDPLAGDVVIRGGTGNVTLVIAPESSATITLRALGGRVDSRVPLTGFIDQDRQEFTGKLGDGTFTLMVETRGGNIILN